MVIYNIITIKGNLQFTTFLILFSVNFIFKSRNIEVCFTNVVIKYLDIYVIINYILFKIYLSNLIGQN